MASAWSDSAAMAVDQEGEDGEAGSKEVQFDIFKPAVQTSMQFCRVRVGT